MTSWLTSALDQEPVYKPTMTRAVTITGKGQFKCQIGC